MEMLSARNITVSVRRSPVMVAHDGEVNQFDAPLEYSIRPGALTVLVP